MLVIPPAHAVHHNGSSHVFAAGEAATKEKGLIKKIGIQKGSFVFDERLGPRNQTNSMVPHHRKAVFSKMT